MSKRVFQLRKKAESNSSQIEQPTPKPIPPPSSAAENKSQVTAFNRQQGSENLIQAVEEEQPNNPSQVGPRLILSKSYLHFEKLIGRVDMQQVRVSNIGNSAIYYEWVKLPRSKINPNAVLDQTPKFFCHHDKNVIKPGESISFVFSFLSKIPGIFIEEYEFRCQPESLIPVPMLKLEGKAIIVDEYEAQRKKYAEELKQAFIEKGIREIISDLIDNVKSPEEPRPDMTDRKAALKQFEKVNENYGLFYNDLIFSWWNGLYQQVANSLSIPQQEQYWNGDITQLSSLISKIPDQITKQCFNERWSSYLHFSRKKTPDRSPLYNEVRELLTKVSLSIAGEFNDTARKELEMWEVPWREPQDTDGEAEKKARDDEVAKIKAEWLKKAKKKKWGEEDQKNLLADYRKRVEDRAKQAILSNFDQLDHAADYIATDRFLDKKPLNSSYFRFLQRLKTVKQAEVEGKVVLLKLQVRMRADGAKKLGQLHEYLAKKKEIEKRLEEERREQEGKDKKKTKKAGKKKEEEQPLPEFDIMEVLDEQCCKEILETVKHIQQRSPKLLILACSFGPRTGWQNPQYSLQFFCEYLKTINQPSITFLRHPQLQQLPQRLQNDLYPDGSTLFLQNLNFLPYQTMQVDKDGTTSKLLMQQIQAGVDLFQQFTDLSVNDNKDELDTGISLYIKKENVLGLAWWKDMGIALKAENSELVLGGAITPGKVVLLEAALWYAKRVFLLGEIGLKFAMVRAGINQVFDVTVSKYEERAIKNFEKRVNMEWQANIPKHKRSPQPRRAQIILPTDILVGPKEGDWQLIKQSTKSVALGQVDKLENKQSVVALDVGQQTVKALLQYISSSKYLFILQTFAIDQRSLNTAHFVFRALFKLREARAVRHAEQSKKGINYRLDTIVILVGNFEELAQKVELKDKPVKIKNAEDEEEQEEEKQEEEGELIKNISLVQDFYLPQTAYVQRLLTGEFIPCLSNITKYKKSDD